MTGSSKGPGSWESRLNEKSMRLTLQFHFHQLTGRGGGRRMGEGRGGPTSDADGTVLSQPEEERDRPQGTLRSGLLPAGSG